MSDKPGLIIIKRPSTHTEEIVNHFPSEDYALLNTSSRIDLGLKTLKSCKPYTVILGLKLDDGNALDLLDIISTKPTDFTSISHIIIVSKHLLPNIRKQINELVFSPGIRMHLFNQDDDDYSYKSILNVLELIQTGYTQPKKALEEIIINHLNNFGITPDKKFAFHFYLYTQEIIEENLENFKMDDLYDISSLSLQSDEVQNYDSIRKGMDYLLKKSYNANTTLFENYLHSVCKSSPTVKTFLRYIALQIKTEFPDII